MLEEAHGVTVHVISHDLGSANGADTLSEKVSALGAPVEILINNVGFGGHGSFLDRGLSTDLSMIDLNVKALVTLSHRIGRDMAARGGGKMLHVSSSASYLPGPLQAVYFATKAFVSSFSQAIDQEMRPQGVTSTKLEPSFVETEFVDAANLNGTRLARNGANAADVARIGYEAMISGRLRVVNDTKTSVLVNWIIPLLPRRTVLKTIVQHQSK